VEQAFEGRRLSHTTNHYSITDKLSQSLHDRRSRRKRQVTSAQTFPKQYRSTWTASATVALASIFTTHACIVMEFLATRDDASPFTALYCGFPHVL